MFTVLTNMLIVQPISQISNN